MEPCLRVYMLYEHGERIGGGVDNEDHVDRYRHGHEHEFIVQVQLCESVLPYSPNQTCQ